MERLNTIALRVVLEHVRDLSKDVSLKRRNIDVDKMSKKLKAHSYN